MDDNHGPMAADEEVGSDPAMPAAPTTGDDADKEDEGEMGAE